MQNDLLLVLCGDAERRQGFRSALSGAGWKRVLSASSMAEAARVLRDVASACVIVDTEPHPGQVRRSLHPTGSGRTR